MSNPILWHHGDMKSTQIWVFKSAIEEKYNVRLSSYEDLRRWSITNLACFWSEVWDFTGMKASVPFTKVNKRVSDLPVRMKLTEPDVRF